nr:hypothetical protein [Tanacetum cinerariifolium]
VWKALLTSCTLTTTLSTTLALTSIVNPIFIDDYKFIDVDDQAVAGGDDASFPIVDDAELLLPPFVTSYGPSHLGPSFPGSSAWLASLLRYTRSPEIEVDSRASLFCTSSTFTVLNVGMPISTGMTASVPYVNANGVSL